MYYICNCFRFTTTTANDEKAFTRLRRWLLYIGPENCKLLQRLNLRIGVPNGLLIARARDDDNAWTALLKSMRMSGCGPHLKLLVTTYEAEPLGERRWPYFHVNSSGFLVGAPANVKFPQRRIKEVMNFYDATTLHLRYLDPQAWAKVGAIARACELEYLLRVTIAECEPLIYTRRRGRTGLQYEWVSRLAYARKYFDEQLCHYRQEQELLAAEKSD
jgi:hypothetical protein